MEENKGFMTPQKNGSRRRGPWRLGGMEKEPGSDCGLDAAFRHLLREVIRQELRVLEEQIRKLLESLSKGPPRGGSNPDEILTVGMIASEMQVIPATVRGWIHSGALKAARFGTGAESRRLCRVRRSDLDAFRATSRSQVAAQEVDAAAEAARIVARTCQRRTRL